MHIIYLMAAISITNLLVFLLLVFSEINTELEVLIFKVSDILLVILFKLLS